VFLKLDTSYYEMLNTLMLLDSTKKILEIDERSSLFFKDLQDIQIRSNNILEIVFCCLIIE